MNDTTETTVVEIVKGLNNEDISKDVEVQRIESTDTRMKNKLLDLISGQVDEISKLDRIISKGLVNLEQRLETNEIPSSEVLSIINTLSNKKIDLSTAILDPFKAAPGGSSPLLPPAKEKDSDSDFVRGVKDMPSEDLKKLEKFFRVIQASSVE